MPSSPSNLAKTAVVLKKWEESACFWEISDYVEKGDWLIKWFFKNSFWQILYWITLRSKSKCRCKELQKYLITLNDWALKSQTKFSVIKHKVMCRAETHQTMQTQRWFLDEPFIIQERFWHYCEQVYEHLKKNPKQPQPKAHKKTEQKRQQTESVRMIWSL